MSDMTLLPTGGGFGGEAGAAGLGGAVGGLIGSWFGNGFNGRGGYGGDGAAVAVGANAVLDGINNIQTGVTTWGCKLCKVKTPQTLPLSAPPRQPLTALPARIRKTCLHRCKVSPD